MPYACIDLLSRQRTGQTPFRSDLSGEFWLHDVALRMSAGRAVGRPNERVHRTNPFRHGPCFGPACITLKLAKVHGGQVRRDRAGCPPLRAGHRGLPIEPAFT
jgi:hypothetical protein